MTFLRCKQEKNTIVFWGAGVNLFFLSVGGGGGGGQFFIFWGEDMGYPVFIFIWGWWDIRFFSN